MKNALLIAGLFLGSVAAAVVIWAAVGGSGGGRRAALVEPTTRGSIGELTIFGVVRAMPVRSFNWHAEWGGSTGNILTYYPLEVLRDEGEDSTALFSFATQLTSAPSASLNLQAPGEPDFYLRYELTSLVRLGEHRAGKQEKLGLRSQTRRVREGEGNAPDHDRSAVVGYMTLRGQRVPILAFESELPLSSHEGGLRAVIRRPLDQLAHTLWEDLAARTVLGTVTIELQTPEETEPHLTYTLENQVTVGALTDSAAAGVAPTEEVELLFHRITVSRGRDSACYEWHVTC